MFLCILWFCQQVASVLSELMENVLVNHPTPSLALASLIPSMLMVDHSTDAVQLLFEQFVHDCNTTIASPVSTVCSLLAIVWLTCCQGAVVCHYDLCTVNLCIFML